MDLLENDFTNTQQNRRRSGPELYTRLWIIRLLQRLLPWNNLVTIAEESFFAELQFGRNRPVLLGHEMVFVEHFVSSVRETESMPTILVTGTLGRHYGTLDALAWSSSLLPCFPHRLHLAGPCPDPKVAAELRQRASSLPHVQLEIFDGYHSQTEIIARIAQADYLLTPYHLSPATQNRIPTKFQEAAAVSTPIIFPANPPWERWCRSRNAAYFLLEEFPNPPAGLGRQNLSTQPWLQTRQELQWNATIGGIKRLL